MKITLKRFFWILPAVAMAAVTLAVHGWGNQAGSAGTSAQGQAAPAGGAQQKQLQKEEALVVAASDIPDTILITGELQAARSREIQVPRIRSGFASAVTYLPLEGTKVKQGDRILEFDASALLTQKSEYERQLDEAKLKIKKTEADLDSQRMDLLIALDQAEMAIKVAKLYADIPKELLPGNNYQKYQLDLGKALLARDKAKEQLANLDGSRQAQMNLVELDKAQAELNLKRMDADIASLQIDAPQDGIVIYGDNWANNRKIQVGDTLFPGMPAVTLPDLASLQVVGFVYDTELRSLSPGMRCDLYLDSVPGKSWQGTIQSLTSVASKKNFASTHKVFRAIVQPDSIDLEAMKPGMTVRMEVPVSVASGSVAIPREYLGLDAAGKYFVLKGTERKTASVQAVTVGAFSDRLIQILSGLTAGDRIFKVQGATGARS
jgi:multidrug resistance efflux pump